MKRLNGAGTRALDVVRQFTLAQRTIAIIGVAVLLLGAVALTSYLAKPTYEVLYSNISAANAAAVTAQLDKDKVPFQLEDGGTTILVAANSVDSERLATASMLSSGAGGYSLLDNMGVTASEFQQNVTYKRAIEGELAKTIGSIDGVNAASVLLAIPQASVFSDDKQQPTASVSVGVSSPLTSDQINAIVHLVAAAYPGLTTDNVTVTDQNGDLLSAGGVTGGSSSDTATQYETTTKDKVQAMLDKVLGPGNSVVTVAADMSNSSGTKQSESYSVPSQAPAFSEASSGTPSSSSTGSGTGQSGVLGVDTTSTTTTATSSGTPTGTGTGSGTGISNSVVKNNALNKTTLTQSIVPGTLNRQTIAVALNTKVAGLITSSALNTLVTNAAGVNLARGDSVSVTQVAFSNAAAKTAAAALAQAQQAQSASQMTELITTAIKVVGGLVLFFLVVTMLRKLFRRQDPIVATPLNLVPQNGYSGDPTVQLGSLGTPTAIYGSQGMGPAGELAASADPEFSQLQADVDALAGSDPEQTAEYLRALMGDRAGV